MRRVILSLHSRCSRIGGAERSVSTQNSRHILKVVGNVVSRQLVGPIMRYLLNYYQTLSCFLQNFKPPPLYTYITIIKLFVSLHVAFMVLPITLPTIHPDFCKIK